MTSVKKRLHAIENRDRKLEYKKEEDGYAKIMNRLASDMRAIDQRVNTLRKEQKRQEGQEELKKV